MRKYIRILIVLIMLLVFTESNTPCLVLQKDSKLVTFRVKLLAGIALAKMVRRLAFRLHLPS